MVWDWPSTDGFQIGRMRNSTVMYAGLIITMLVGGLWHGPTWTFVLWGALHGVGLAFYRWFSDRQDAQLDSYVCRFDHNNAGRRFVARTDVDVCSVGSAAWCGTGLLPMVFRSAGCATRQLCMQV